MWRIVALFMHDYHSSALWLCLNPPLYTCVPVTEDVMYLSRGCGRWSVRTYPFLSSQCLIYIPFWKHRHASGFTRWHKPGKPTLTHALVTHCSYVSVGAGGLMVRQGLPPTEQAWLSLEFTTSLIDLLIIFFTGDLPVGDQGPSLYSILFFSIPFCCIISWIDKA